MKKDIHPKYAETQYHCACGEDFTIPSTQSGVVKLDICHKCHPLYSGKDKVIDTEGRIERFKKKYAKA